MAWNLFRELGRKAIHLAILIILLIYSLIKAKYSQQLALLTMVALLIILLISEYLRLELGWKMYLLSFFIRPKEYHRMYGAVYFLLSTIIALSVFDFKIAIAALLMTAFGDIVAAIVGRKYGTILVYRNKTWAGCLSELFVNLAVGFIVLASTYNIYVIIGMVFTATAVETLVDELDDNLFVPIFSGFAGQMIKFAF